jgi:HAD superfamily hydrolase (TIGR01484 family)
MRYFALATDYDGTLAHHGHVEPETAAALERLSASGRKLLLVTGREIPSLLVDFPYLGVFDLVVAENGGLLYRPSGGTSRPLAERPPRKLMDALRERGVRPVSRGQVVVATWHPHETVVLEVIRDLGLELQITFNKGAVMVLPTGVNKASGLERALRELRLSPRNTVGIGDAENDHAFLAVCEYSVAVANALPAVKERCDAVTSAAWGGGVVDVIEELLTHDLVSRRTALGRHGVLVGIRGGEGDEEELRLPAQGTNLLVAGSPGGGKSDMVTGLLQRLVEGRYQVLVIDPEGDYDLFPDVVHLGTSARAPTVDEVVHALDDPRSSAVVNLLGCPLDDRPPFLRHLLERLRALRARVGRPHRVVLDEAHHLLPAYGPSIGDEAVKDVDGLVLVAPGVDLLDVAVRGLVEQVAALGEDPAATIAGIAAATDLEAPDLSRARLEDGQGLFWSPVDRREVIPFWYAPGTVEHRRHVRKYAQGDVGFDRGFHFRGDGGLELTARNLQDFMRLGEDLDDDTWRYHLGRGDYTRWFRDVIRDDELADEADDVRRRHPHDPDAGRRRVREAIERRYTAPASMP